MAGEYKPYIDKIFEHFQAFTERYPHEFRFNDFTRFLLEPKADLDLQRTYIELLYTALQRSGGPLDGANQAIGARLSIEAPKHGYTEVSRGKDTTLWGTETPDSSIYRRP